MTKAKSDAAKRPTHFVLGQKAFAAISAVEGLVLNSVSEKRLKDLVASDLTPEERRKAVIAAYSASKAPG